MIKAIKMTREKGRRHGMHVMVQKCLNQIKRLKVVASFIYFFLITLPEAGSSQKKDNHVSSALFSDAHA